MKNIFIIGLAIGFTVQTYNVVKWKEKCEDLRKTTQEALKQALISQKIAIDSQNLCAKAIANMR